MIVTGLVVGGELVVGGILVVSGGIMWDPETIIHIFKETYVNEHLLLQ